jgi:outer membrane protein
MRSRYHPFHLTEAVRPYCTLDAGERNRLLCSPERLQGEFIIRAYRFAPPTGSLESPQRLLLLFTAFVNFCHFRNIKRIKSSCFIKKEGLFWNRKQSIFVQYSYQPAKSPAKEVILMKQPVRLILLTLLACSFSAPAYAAEAASDKPASIPSLLPVAPLTITTPSQKPSEGASAQQSMRLGHVDLARIAAESETGKAGQSQLADLKKKLQGQIEAKRKQLDKQKTAIESKLKTLTPPQREAKAREFQKKVEEFQTFGINAEKQLQARQEEFSDKLFKAIEQASAELGKAKGLALVVIKRELLFLGSGVDAQDVTDEVIKKVDKK